MVIAKKFLWTALIFCSFLGTHKLVAQTQTEPLWVVFGVDNFFVANPNSLSEQPTILSESNTTTQVKKTKRPTKRLQKITNLSAQNVAKKQPAKAYITAPFQSSSSNPFNIYAKNIGTAVITSGSSSKTTKHELQKTALFFTAIKHKTIDKDTTKTLSINNQKIYKNIQNGCITTRPPPYFTT